MPDRKTKVNVGVFTIPDDFESMSEEEQLKIAGKVLADLTGAKGVENAGS